jgi:hypothetical protein
MEMWNIGRKTTQMKHREKETEKERGAKYFIGIRWLWVVVFGIFQRWLSADSDN